MKYIISSLILFSIIFSLYGCQTITDDSVSLPKDKILKIIRTGNTGVDMLLGFAESRGKDVIALRETADASFTLLYSIFEVEINEINYEDLRAAIKQIRDVGNNALSLCLVSGVSASVIEQISIYLNDMYVVLDVVLAHLSSRI
jgi:hypothetical protein